MASEPLHDIEIVAELFQLARTELYYTKETLMAQAALQFPNESAERLEACAVQLGERLKQANYNNLADEFFKPGRRRPAKKSA